MGVIVTFVVEKPAVIGFIVILLVAFIVVCCSCMWIFAIEKFHLQDQHGSCGFPNCCRCGRRRNMRYYRPVPPYSDIYDIDGYLDGRDLDDTDAIRNRLPRPGTSNLDPKFVIGNPPDTGEDSDLDILIRVSGDSDYDSKLTESYDGSDEGESDDDEDGDKSDFDIVVPNSDANIPAEEV